MGIAGLMLTSCSKDDIDTYSTEYDTVRFASTGGSLLSKVTGHGYEMDSISGTYYSDSVFYSTFSFIDYPDSDAVNYDFPVMLVGKTADYDRTVNYEVDNVGGAKDYEVVQAVIPANSTHGYIRLRLNLNEELSDSTYEINFHLLPSKDFITPPPAYSHANFLWNNQIPLPQSSNLRRTYNMLIQSPINYLATSNRYISPNAMRAIVAALGWNDWDDAVKHGSKANGASAGYYKYLPQYRWLYADNSYQGYAAIIGRWLDDYEKTHGHPLLHDAGVLRGQPVQARSY